MKPSLFIPPVAALALAGTWLAIQHQAITTLEQQSAALHKAIAAHSSDASAESPNTKPADPTKAANAKDPIDWKKIAEQFTDSARILQAGGTGDMRMIVRFRERLQAMSKEELVAAYDEIAALDFPTDTREMLEAMILEPLVEKDLEFALARFLDRLDKNNGTITGGQISIQLSIRLYVQLSSAMQKWAEKDPASVTAWFDQQIAAGKFDSKSISGNSHSRIYVEEFLLDTLLSTDPEAAGRRLAAIPEGGRYTVLEQISYRILKDEEQLAFATLVREQVSKENQARCLAVQACLVGNEGGYAKATEFLDRIHATPVERSASVGLVAKTSIQTITQKSKITREDIDTLREWVTTQAPESTGRATGRALADAVQGRHKLEFSEAAELAVQYHEASDNDDVLSSFLAAGPARQNKEQARILAGKISDAKRREEILQNLQ